MSEQINPMHKIGRDSECPGCSHESHWNETPNKCCANGNFGQAHDCEKKPTSGYSIVPTQSVWPAQMLKDLDTSLKIQALLAAQNHAYVGPSVIELATVAFEQVCKERDAHAAQNLGRIETIIRLEKQRADLKAKLWAEECQSSMVMDSYYELKEESDTLKAELDAAKRAFEYLVSMLPENCTAGFVTHARAIASGNQAETKDVSNDSSYWKKEYVYLSDLNQKLRKENSKLDLALEDFEKHGLRADLNPTQPMGDWEEVTTFFLRYLKSIDESVSERARQARTQEEK